MEEYRALAAERYGRWREEGGGCEVEDVYVGAQLSEKLLTQWREYLVRAALKGSDPVLYKYRRGPTGQALGRGEIPAGSVLDVYVRQVARIRYQTYKEHGYRFIVKPCTTRFGIRGLGDVQSDNSEDVLSVNSTNWLDLALYKEAQAAKWNLARSVRAHKGDKHVGTSVEPRKPRVLGSGEGLFMSELLQTYVEIARLGYAQRPLGNARGNKTPALGHRTQTFEITHDTFEMVAREYECKPDELYKRKSSKRYAAFKRKRAELEQREIRKFRRAETEMLRRRVRDGDRVRADENSLNRFFFCNENNTYAYCTKIPEAGRYKDSMLEKYSQAEPNEEEALTAQEILTSKPSFNMRVMNRFG
ncbi:hypothetical protein NDN08_000585 [Rhodosorus marinus]|uniref:Uncharacterized protein n=1 Tax=Rhodosorus marinus TaxID=101924 RepID=A0AAV8UND4_9RHOD|nr:hypothetical protein NDN08_000585 [Rhodosorus marinus]